MIKVGMAVMADYASFSIGGKLNIMGIFDNIVTKSLPATVAHAYLVIRLVADSSESGKKLDSKIELIDEDGNAVLGMEGYFVVPQMSSGKLEIKHDQIFPIFNLTFDKTGMYEFKIIINGEVRGSIPLAIALMPDKQKNDGLN